MIENILRRASVEVEAIGKTGNRGADRGDDEDQPDQGGCGSNPFKTFHGIDTSRKAKSLPMSPVQNVTYASGRSLASAGAGFLYRCRPLA
ncbi:hypothetical protein [Martelella sp. AMO21009]